MKQVTNAHVITWNIINSAMAGFISFLSAMLAFITDKGFDSHEILTALAIAIGTGSLVAAYKFKDFTDGEVKSHNKMLFNFYNL